VVQDKNQPRPNAHMLSPLDEAPGKFCLSLPIILFICTSKGYLRKSLKLK
jgi:hypothetical protein